jgi:thiol-disulfide isomerase/thioredoxin
MNDARPRRRWWRAVLVLLALQAVAVGVYVLKERATERGDVALALERVDEPAPVLALERPGSRRGMDADESPLVLHLWATWCEPCREELPALLALDADAAGATLVAASVDENWAVVEHFFEGDVPPDVWRVTGGRERVARQTLPVTLIVRGARVRARFEGSRRWSQQAFEDALAVAIAAP